MCSTQKSSCSFPCGQKSVLALVIFQGFTTVVFYGNQSIGSIISPLHNVSLSNRVTPFCLSLSSHKDCKHWNNTAFSSIRLFSCSPVFDINSFHFHMQNQRHSSLFCMLHWTFAFCLVPHRVQSFSFVHSLFLKVVVTLFSIRQPLCVSVWMCFVFFCTFVFCMCRDVCPVWDATGEWPKAATLTHENKKGWLPANIVPTLSHFNMSNIYCFDIMLFGWTRTTRVTVAISLLSVVFIKQPLKPLVMIKLQGKL